MSIIIEPTMLAALAGVIASLISALYSLFRKKSEIDSIKKKSERLRSRATQISIDLGLVKFTQSLEQTAENIPKDEIIEQLEGRILRRLSEQPNLTDEGIDIAVKSDLNEFRERIDKIESRFPEESKIEKIASINDALLSERIDQLKERVDRLGNKILNRWDVALTVSAIIGGIITIVVTTYSVIKFLEKT